VNEVQKFTLFDDAMLSTLLKLNVIEKYHAGAI